MNKLEFKQITVSEGELLALDHRGQVWVYNEARNAYVNTTGCTAGWTMLSMEESQETIYKGQ